MHFQGSGPDQGFSYPILDTDYESTSPVTEISSSDPSLSADEDDMNERLTPFWPKYRQIFSEQGLHLDTVRDVKCHFGSCVVQRPLYSCQSEVNDDALCPDPSLPDRLFRGIRLIDRRRFVAKAVHARSRECEVISRLSCPSLKKDPMNHAIPVMDIFTDVQDNVVFIVMEEWSPQVLAQICCPPRFMVAIRQWIEHVAFMHKHDIAHLDISLRNLVTDGKGRYAYIDFEHSRPFPPSLNSHSVYNYHGTEEPPECVDQTRVDPFKVDIWALGVLILRACKLTGIWVPELMELISPMLNKDPNCRPTSSNALLVFDRLIAFLGERLGAPCQTDDDYSYS